MNTETLGRSIEEEREGLTADVEASGDTPRFSGAIRLMQQPGTKMTVRSATAAELERLGFARGRRRGKGREWKDQSALFIRRKG